MGRTDTNVRHAKRTPSYCHRPTTLPSTRIRHDATRMYLRLLRRARVLSCCWLCLPRGSGCISWPTRTFQSMKCPKRCIIWSRGTPPSDRPTTTHRKAPRLRGWSTNGFVRWSYPSAGTGSPRPTTLPASAFWSIPRNKPLR